MLTLFVYLHLQKLTVTVEFEDNPPVQVDVLDTDTIEQAKEKIMDIVFKVSLYIIIRLETCFHIYTNLAKHVMDVTCCWD